MANDSNSGDRNSGDSNSGHWNSGDSNSGHWNSGHWNSGDRNSGHWNSGDRNSGDRNSGHWNSGDRNSGFLNTTKQPIRMFNVECVGLERGDIEFPDFFYFDICTWIASEKMSDSEKSDNETHETTGGYLKTIDYKQAWQESYAKASVEDKAKVLALPNFDADIFFEITGIRVTEKSDVEERIQALENELAILKQEVSK